MTEQESAGGQQEVTQPPRRGRAIHRTRAPQPLRAAPAASSVEGEVPRRNSISVRVEHPGAVDDVSRPAPYGWRPALVVALVALVDRMETFVVSGVLPLLQDEWGFSDTVAGAIPVSLAFAGIIAAVPAGILADRHNRKNVVAVVVALWSVITLGSGLAPSFAIFFLTRFSLGFADSLEQPSVLSLIADKYSPKVRARAYSWQRMANSVGAPLGVMLGAAIGSVFGWRWAFFVMVVPGLIVAWLVYRMREPERGAIDREAAHAWAEQSGGDPDEILQLLQQASPSPRPNEMGDDSAPSWSERARRAVSEVAEIVRSSVTLRYLYLAMFLSSVGVAGYSFWLPTVFERVHDMELERAGTLVGVSLLVGLVVGVHQGGRLGTRLHGQVVGGRILLTGLGIGFGGLLLIPAIALHVIALQMLILMLAVGFFGVAQPNVPTAIADVVVAHQRGRAFALVQVAAALGGAFGPLFIGIASDVTGSLVLAMCLLAPFTAAGGFLLLRVRRVYDEQTTALMASQVKRGTAWASPADRPR